MTRLLHAVKLVTVLYDAYKMITLFCCKNQNSDKTVGLNNLAAGQRYATFNATSDYFKDTGHTVTV